MVCVASKQNKKLILSQTLATETTRELMMLNATFNTEYFTPGFSGIQSIDNFK